MVTEFCYQPFSALGRRTCTPLHSSTGTNDQSDSVTAMVTENALLVVEGHRRDSLTRDTATASAGVRWPSPSPEPKVVGSNPAWRTPPASIPYPFVVPAG